MFYDEYTLGGGGTNAGSLYKGKRFNCWKGPGTTTGKGSLISFFGFGIFNLVIIWA